MNLALLPIAADVALPDPNHFSSIGWVVVILVAVVVAVNQVMELVARGKPVPPLAQQFAARDDLEALKSGNTATHAQLFNRIAQVQDDIAEQLNEITRHVERLDERSVTTTKTVETIREELTEVGKEVTSALAEIRSRR